MSLSPEIAKRLELALQHEKSYRPNPEIQRELGSRSLVMVIAPATIGKTAVMREVRELDDRFGMSSVISTRSPRDDDEPGLFRLYEHTGQNLSGILDTIDTGEMVQYTFHPTEHTFYGSELEDHPHEHNMLATLSGGIDQLKEVGFLDTTVIGLTAPPCDWRKWFDRRYPIHHAGRAGRLNEAERSYADLLDRDDVRWVINREGRLHEAAQGLIAAVDGPSTITDDALAYISRIRQLIADAKRHASYTDLYE